MEATLILAATASLTLWAGADLASADELSVGFWDFPNGTACLAAETDVEVKLIELDDGFRFLADGRDLQSVGFTCTLPEGRQFTFDAGSYAETGVELTTILVNADGSVQVFKTDGGLTMLTHDLQDALRWIM